MSSFDTGARGCALGVLPSISALIAFAASPCAVGVPVAPPSAASSTADDRGDPAVEVRVPYEIVVTPRGRRQRAFDSPRGMDLVDRAALLRRQPRDLPDVLKGAPGVLVQETNRGAGTPVVRGLLGPNNLYMIDYTRFLTSLWRDGPSQYLSLVDASALRAVEVVRGPGSVRYGNGAMGGVVHLLTARAPDGRREPGWSGAAGFQGSSADLGAAGHLNVSYAGRGVSIRLGASAARFGRLAIGAGRGGHEPYPAYEPLSAYRQGGWNGRADLHLPHDWRLTATYLGFVMAGAPRAEGLGKGDYRRYDNTDHLAILTLVREPEHPEGAIRGLRFAASLHRLSEGIRRVRCDRARLPGGLRDCIDESPGVVERVQTARDGVLVPGTIARASFAWLEDDRLTLDIGADAYLDLVRSTAQVATAADSFREVADDPRFADGSTYLDTGAFAGTGLRLAKLGPAGDLHLSLGGRLSRITAHAPDVPGVGAVDYAHTGAVGSVGLQLLSSRRHNLYLNYLQGFRAPRLEETTVLGDTGSQYELPNRGLRPIRSETIELGGRIGRRRVFSVAGTVFLSRLSGAITSVPARTADGAAEVDGKRVTRRVNAGSSLYRGLELVASVRIRRIRLDAHATWTMADDTLPDGTIEPARRIPPLFGRLGVRYLHPDRSWRVEAFARGAGRQERLSSGDRRDLRICETARYSGRVYADRACPGTPAWTTLNLRASWRRGRRFEFRLGALNLADTRYKTHGSGFFAPGRELRLSMLLRL